MKTVASHLASLLTGRNLSRQSVLFARYLMVLVGVVLLYGWLFHVIMAWEGQDHSWFTGIYWALTVMSTLGFGDITFHTDLGRAFSTIVLLSGLVLLLIILPFLFIRHVYAPWLEQRTQTRLSDLREVPEDVSGHVLICASDPIALALVHLAGFRVLACTGHMGVTLQFQYQQHGANHVRRQSTTLNDVIYRSWCKIDRIEYLMVKVIKL